MHRLFFALWPDAPVREAIASRVHDMPDFARHGRLVASEKYHLTLDFLGVWPEAPAETIRASLRAGETARAPAFDLVIDRAGGFDGSRVGWLAPETNTGLDVLRASLHVCMESEGLRGVDTPTFSPHVTVLRNVQAPLGEEPVQPILWRIDDFVLIHSHAGHYDMVGRWALATR